MSGLFSDDELDQEKLKEERKNEIIIETKKSEEIEFVPNGKTLYLLDGYSIIYRSYFAHMRSPIMGNDGTNQSAYFGFFQTLFHLLNTHNNVDALAVTMDEKEETFRHKMYNLYKANRDKAPEDLHSQVPLIKDTLQKMNIPVLSKGGYEADDVMASVARRAHENNWEVVVVSGDKDLTQLVSEGISILRPPKGDEKEYVLMKEADVKAFYGVYPKEIPDYLAILGDKSDNVPGISGLGEKGAVKLLEKYVSLEGIYRHLDSLSPKDRKKMEDGKADAFLSLDLVKLCYSAIPDNFDLSLLERERFTITEGSKEFLKKGQSRLYNMYGKLGTREEREEELPESSNMLKDEEKYLLKNGDYKTIDDYKKLSSFLLDKGRNKREMALSIMGDKDSGVLYGFSFALEPFTSYFVPVGENGLSKSEIKDIFDNYLSLFTLVTHDAKDALLWAWNISSDLNPNFDTMIYTWLLDSNRGDYSLETTIKSYFGFSLSSDKKIDLSTLTLEEKTKKSGAESDYIFRLFVVLKNRLISSPLCKVYSEIEKPLTRILAGMETEGIYLSSESLKKMSDEEDKELSLIRTRIFEYATHEFNLNSPLQLSDVLFGEMGLTPGKKTTRGFSTDTETLETIKNESPIIPLILSYRAINKLKTTYVDVLPLLRDEKGRIHTTFLQTGTATGRLSSRNPNLQNIPVRSDEGRMIRGAFIPKDGHIFISADYSQIELVVLAWLSGDKNLSEAFIMGKDVHTSTASQVFNKDEKDVTPKERRMAKTINFGIMYGMSAFRLAEDLEIPRSEAVAFIKKYFENYSGVKDLIEETNRSAEKNGYVLTHWGHKREIIGINSSNKTVKAAAERTAINTLIQGTAAEIMKFAMIKIDNKIISLGLKSKILLQVHDELIFEVPFSEEETMKKIIKDTMESAVELPIPLRVSIESGMHWGDMH